MNDKTKAIVALSSIYDDYGFDVERAMIEIIMEGLGYSTIVIYLALEAWDYDHCPNY